MSGSYFNVQSYSYKPSASSANPFSSYGGLRVPAAHQQMLAARHPVSFGTELHASVKKRDLYRDTLVRYFGFANEFTEAVKDALPAPIGIPLNLLGWLTAFGYGLADATSKGLDAQQQALQKHHHHDRDRRRAEGEGMAAFGRGAFFHSIASWFGPVYIVINPVKWLVKKFITERPVVGTLAALATIPVIPKLLDPIAEFASEHIYAPIADHLVNAYTNRR